MIYPSIMLLFVFVLLFLLVTVAEPRPDIRRRSEASARQAVTLVMRLA